MAEARAARLAAVEARLAGTPVPNLNSDQKVSKEEPKFEPTEKGDTEKKKEFTKLLYRGVVRDNAYRETMWCVDVSLWILLISFNFKARYGWDRVSDRNCKVMASRQPSVGMAKDMQSKQGIAS